MRLIFCLFFILLQVSAFSQIDSTYYSNGALSVSISDWSNGQRLIRLYDLEGDLTYTMEEWRKSYSVSVNLEFAKNGSVKMATTRTNPGASRYQFESETTFDPTNQPLTRLDRRIPEELLDPESNSFYFWSRKKRAWLKQNTVECQPVQTK